MLCFTGWALGKGELRELFVLALSRKKAGRIRVLIPQENLRIFLYSVRDTFLRNTFDVNVEMRWTTKFSDLFAIGKIDQKFSILRWTGKCLVSPNQDLYVIVQCGCNVIHVKGVENGRVSLENYSFFVFMFCSLDRKF